MAIPEAEPGAANFWGLRRDRVGRAKNAAWMVHYEVEDDG